MERKKKPFFASMSFDDFEIDEWFEDTDFDPEAVKAVTLDIPPLPVRNGSQEATSETANHKKPSNKKEKPQNIHQGHRQRIIDKLLEHGLEPFSEHEVLELLLFYAIPRRDTNALGHALIAEFGSLHNVFKADPSDLQQVDGIGKNAAALIYLFRCLTPYLNARFQEKICLADTTSAGLFCCSYFLEHVEESFIVLILDSNRCIKKIEVISHGTENETAFYPRKVLKAVIKHRANAIIIAHNHPGGNVQPSANDIKVTNEIIQLVEGINVPVRDHFICCGQVFTSFAERGILGEPGLS